MYITNKITKDTKTFEIYVNKNGNLGSDCLPIVEEKDYTTLKNVENLIGEFDRNFASDFNYCFNNSQKNCAKPDLAKKRKRIC